MAKGVPGDAGEARKKAKKSVLLRIDAALWDEIAAWAEDEFRSVNGQMEYLLHEAVREHRKKKKSE